MKKEDHPLANSIHRYFGAAFNNKLWGYFEQRDRTAEDTEDMIHAAHASLLHWKIYKKSTAVNEQRGEYMLGKAYMHAGNRDTAMHHAQRCMKLTEDHPDDMKDFDIGYANELMARIQAMHGNKEDFEEYHKKAIAAGEAISGKGDKEYFEQDLAAGPWFGLK